MHARPLSSLVCQFVRSLALLAHTTPRGGPTAERVNPSDRNRNTPPFSVHQGKSVAFLRQNLGQIATGNNFGTEKGARWAG